VGRTHRKPILPPAYLAAALLAMLLVHFAAPMWHVIAFPASLLGLVPIAAGVTLNVLADRTFKSHDTTVKPFERSRRLVTDGVFARSRHPMYLGMVLIAGGVAVLLGTILPFVVVLAFAVWLDVRFISAEERMLAETFGTSWQCYRKRVRRWL